MSAIKQRLADSQTARRDIEKEVASIQSRLSKYKDQLMEVKTNKEYQAMQKEIATAEEAVRSHEDRILDRMEEADTLARGPEGGRDRAQTPGGGDREGAAGPRRGGGRARHAGRSGVHRTHRLARELSPAALRLFEHVARQRKGLAVAEARDGHCMVCQVRIRPQIYNEVRRNESLIQCDSCLRILYFVPSPSESTASPAS